MKTKYYGMLIVYVALLLTLVLVSSCGEDVAQKGLQVEMKATTTNSRITKGGRVAATGYAFKEAMIGISEFEFETLEEDDSENEDGEDDNEEIEFEGNYAVDLIAGTSNPEFAVSSIRPGLYEEVEIELGRALPNNNTMFIQLKYKPDGADSVTVEFSTQDKLEFEFENEDGFLLEADAFKNMLVLINLDVLFEGVDFSNASLSDDGVIRINDSSNSSLAEKIKDNLEDSCEVGEDDDDDDEIDDDND
jgi:hypothetical protein